MYRVWNGENHFNSLYMEKGILSFHMKTSFMKTPTYEEKIYLLFIFLSTMFGKSKCEMRKYDEKLCVNT
jgi:hypothetical protein